MTPSHSQTEFLNKTPTKSYYFTEILNMYDLHTLAY